MFPLNPQTWRTLSLCLMLTLFPILTRCEETVFDAGQSPTQTRSIHLSGESTHTLGSYLALISRKLVDLSSDSVGTFATVFPSDHPDLPGTPSRDLPAIPLFTLLAGEPFSLQQYYARYEQRQHLILPWRRPIDSHYDPHAKQLSPQRFLDPPLSPHLSAQ